MQRIAVALQPQMSQPQMSLAARQPSEKRMRHTAEKRGALEGQAQLSMRSSWVAGAEACEVDSAARQRCGASAAVTGCLHLKRVRLGHEARAVPVHRGRLRIADTHTWLKAH